MSESAGSSNNLMKWILNSALKLGAAGVLLGAAVSPAAESSSPPFKDVHGKSHSPLSASDQKATVLFFVLHDCPVCNTYAPEINRLVAEYLRQGIRSYIVYVEAGLPAAVARKHVKDYGFSCPALLDPTHRLARFCQAAVAPGVAVLSPENALLYRGRIDDRAIAPGKLRVEPTQRDLKQALDCVLAGKPVPHAVTSAVGCYIENLQPSESHEN